MCLRLVSFKGFPSSAPVHTLKSRLLSAEGLPFKSVEGILGFALRAI